MAVYTANTDTLVARLSGREPPGVERLFDCAAAGRDGIEATPVHVAAAAAVVSGERAVVRGERADAWREADDKPGRAAVRALLNGPVTVPRIGGPTLLRVARWLDDHGLADATLLAAHETRRTTGILTSDGAIRETGVTVIWA